MTRSAILLTFMLTVVGCGSELPARYVIERDIDGLVYRRYQKTLDIELAVEGNEATGHTATYLRRGSGKRVAVATAFVTVYERAASLTAEVRERLMALERYKLTVQKLGGRYAWMLDAGPSERWALWVSGRHLIKLGAPQDEAIPEALADAYMNIYPSDLDEHGRAQAGTTSAGSSKRERAESTEQDKKPEREVPHYLRENAPR
jgi:hypothetical protein